jgi:hypothetical protein
MLEAVVATIPATFAALAAWWGVRGGPAWRERMEAKLDDLLDWQVSHERDHISLSHRRRGGMQ